MTGPLTEAQFRDMVEQFVKEQGSYANAAKVLGVTEGFLLDYLIAHRGDSAKLAAYFGLQPSVVYMRLGENKK